MTTEKNNNSYSPDEMLTAFYNVFKRNIDEEFIVTLMISEDERRKIRSAGDYLLEKGLIICKMKSKSD